MIEEAKEQPAPANINEGDKPAEASMLDKADAIVKRLEDANKRSEELLRQNTELYTRMRMRGEASAGSINKTPEQIQKEKDDVERKATIEKFYKN